MTRFRALMVSGALLLGFGFNFAGCFDFDDECPEFAAAAGAAPQPCPD